MRESSDSQSSVEKSLGSKRRKFDPSVFLSDSVRDEEKSLAARRAEEAMGGDALLLEQAKAVRVFTVPAPPGLGMLNVVGIVFGNSSKQAFWGLSSQADRLSRAYEAALLNLKYDAATKGANAVVGVSFALNNSTGSSAALAGSSEAVMLIGTAVRVEDIVD